MAENSMKPRIRFKGFTDAWEQRKVGELLIERNEQTPKSDEYPLMAFIANEGVAPKGERYDRSSLINDTENKLYKRTEYGDFIYSSNNLETGSIGVNKYGNATISPVYSIFYTTELADSDFIGRRLIRKDFINEMVKWRQGVIYGQWRIHEDDFVKIKICVPKTCEQRKIGAILDNLDNLITLHQCKDFALDTNKAFQQRCLLSIKSANAWEQRKAKTLFISYAEKGYPELPVLSATQDKGMVYRDDTGKNIFHDKNNEISYKRVQPGQFVIHLRSFQGGFAHSNILGITSPAYTIFGFKDDEKQCDLYWKYVFCSSEFVKRLETVTYGIRDGRSISYDEFLIMKFIVPKYEEQVQIASILIEIDNLITLHQRKQTIKKRSKMDEKRRVNYLMIANAWEQRELGEVGDTYAGLSGKSKEDFGHGEAEFVPYMNVFTNPIADVTMTEAIEIDDRQAKVKNGDVLFTTSSETPEEVGMSSVWLKNGSNTYLNSFCFGFRPSESINSFYLAYMLRSSGVRRKIVFLAQGISRYNISKKKMMEIKVPMPICAEQRQLGEIFRLLDNLITLHQRGLIKIQGDKKWQKRKFQKNCSAIILNAG